jgi:hypothetical protein
MLYNSAFTKRATTGSYTYHICGGNVPRPDDVLKMLLPMLEPHETLSIVGSSVQSIATEGELIRRAVETRRLGNRFEQL